MKELFFVFCVIVVILAALLLGAVGTYKFVLWTGWPHDILVVFAVVGVVLSFSCMLGWQIGMQKNINELHEKNEQWKLTQK